MSENKVRDTQTSSRWGLAVGAGLGVISGVAAALVATALGVSFADETPDAASTSPRPALTTVDIEPIGSHWPTSVETGAIYPEASVMTTEVLDRIGDLWRFEVVWDIQGDGPAVFYLASPTGTRYEVGKRDGHWSIEHWDVSSSTVLLRNGYQGNLFTLDLRSGLMAPSSTGMASTMTLIDGSGPRRYWIGGGVFTWDGANGWEEVGTLADGTQINQFGSTISPDGRFLVQDSSGRGGDLCLQVADLQKESARMTTVGPTGGCRITTWEDERTLLFASFEDESTIQRQAVFSDDGTVAITQVGEPTPWNTSAAPESAPSSYRAYQFPGSPLILLNGADRGALTSIGAVTANDIARLPVGIPLEGAVVDRVDEIRDGTYRVTFNSDSDPLYVLVDLPGAVVLTPPAPPFGGGLGNANTYHYRLALADDEFGWTVYAPEMYYGE